MPGRRRLIGRLDSVGRREQQLGAVQLGCAEVDAAQYEPVQDDCGDRSKKQPSCDLGMPRRFIALSAAPSLVEFTMNQGMQR